MRSGRLNRVCEIQYKTVTLDGDYGTEQIEWAKKATVWVEKMDVLPSKSEAVKNALNTNTNQSRIRMKYRTDIDTTMRFVIDDIVYQIVSGPAEIGYRDMSEFIAERYTA